MKEEVLVLSDKDVTKKCIDCGEVKPVLHFQKGGKNYRPECKDCDRNRRMLRREKDEVKFICNQKAGDILKRTGGYQTQKENAKNASYKRRGVKCLIGTNRKQVSAYLYENFKEDIESILLIGEIPSVDRIDPYGNYEEGNIRIISASKNNSETGRRVKAISPEGEEYVFNTVKAAANYVGCKRDTVYLGISSGTERKNGWTFIDLGFS